MLSGGAARGAYEAGALRFVFADLVPRLGPGLWPRIVSGSSVGAINGAVVATHSSDEVTKLSAIWRQLTVDQVYDLKLQTGWRFLRSAQTSEPFALLDATPLSTLLRERFPFDMLRRSIDEAACSVFAVTATDLASGRNTLFVDSGGRPLPKRLGANEVPARAGLMHCLASAAIPFLFAPIEIGGRYYVDGGLRHNTPLRPVLRAGADRILVVGPKALSPKDDAPSTDRVIAPNLPFLAGKTLNALLLDPVERDLQQLSRLNRILEWGERTYGPGFATQIEDDLLLRRVDTLFLAPSVDLGAMADTVFRAKPPKTSKAVQWLLRFVADRVNSAEGDLLSYLYFDRAYTAELESIGFEDARKQEEAVANFLLRAPSELATA